MRREINTINRLVSSTDSHRASFVRYLYIAKVRPLVEYAAGIWSSSISRCFLSEIDSLQIHYFRKCLGFPPGTRTASILLDNAVERQSLRFLAERLKLSGMMQSGFCSRPLAMMHKNFSIPDRCAFVTKSFPSATKSSSVRAREKFIRNFPDILLRKGLTPQEFLSKCTRPDLKYTYGFWNVFPVSTKKASWKSILHIFPPLKFPVVPSDIVTDLVNHAKNSVQDIAGTGWRLDLIRMRRFRDALKGKIRIHIRDTQLSEFLELNSSHGLSRYRNSWYHDPLILFLNFPSARTIRKMRVGSSELACDSFFLKENNSRKCKLCTHDVLETHDHFFYHL